MSKIFIPNIIITRDFDYIRSFVNAGGYTKIGDLPRNENTLILSNQQNKYITGFSYDLGSQTASSKTFTMTLEILDSDGQFQDLFLDSNVYSKMIERIMRAKARTGANYTQAKPEYKQELLTLYFMFGIGDSIKDWSDPIRCNLTNANIIYENGVRKYTFEFLSNPDNYLLRPRIDPDLKDPNPSYQLNFGAQKFNTVVEYGLTTKEYFDYDAFQDAKYRQSQKGIFSKLFTSDEATDLRKRYKDIEKKVTYKLVNVQDNITRLLKLYVGSCCNVSPRNVIVVLPGFESDKTDWEKQRTRNGLEGFYFYDIYKRRFGIDVVRDEEPPAKIAIVNKITKIQAGQKDVELELDEKTKSPYDKDIDTIYKLRLTATAPSSKEAMGSNSAQMPDWWESLNTLFQGIDWALKAKGDNFSVNLVVYEEFNVKFLQLFADFGMIENPQSPCIIIGDQTMIQDYLYCNKIGTSGMYTADELIKYESNAHFSDKDPLKEILENGKAQYRVALLRAAFKQKGNSSFGEDVVLDELAITDNDQNSNDVKKISDVYAMTDLPTFTHNYKNSNVISFSVEDNQTFLNAVVGVFNVEQQTAYGALLDVSGTDYYSIKDLFSDKDLQELREFKENLIKNYEQHKNSKISGNSPFAGQSPLLTDDISKLDVEISDAEKNYLKNIYGFDGNLNIQARELYNGLEAYETSQWAQAAPIKKSAIDLLNSGDQTAMKNANDFVQLLQQGRAGQSSVVRNREKEAAMHSINMKNVTYLDLLYQQQLAKKYPHYTANQLITATEQMRNILNSSRDDVYAPANNPYKISAPHVFVPAHTGPHADGIRQKIQHYMLSQMFKLSIRTLPFFHICSLRSIGTPCLFFSRRPVIHGSQAPREIPDYISGVYFINKIRHVISLNECYSEFELTRLLTPDDVQSKAEEN